MISGFNKQEWYTPAEVAIHNSADDCWISFNGKVLDLTSWLEEQFKVCQCLKSCGCSNKNWYCQADCVQTCPCFNRGFLYCDAKRLASTIVAYAGKDVSHWFHGDDWIRYIHPTVNISCEYQRHGSTPDRPVVPSTRWRPYRNPWWLDPGLVIGKVTAKTRPIRILNTLTGSTVTLEVCSEETLYQIMLRYLPHNAHMGSYAWRYMGRGLNLDRTLQQNGIEDERERFSDVALPENIYIPAILIYYNDDLTEDIPKPQCPCEVCDCMEDNRQDVFADRY